MTTVEPYHVIATGEIQIDGPALTVNVVPQWQPQHHRRGSLIRPRLHLITFQLHDTVEPQLINKLLLVMVRELPTNAVVTDAEGNGLSTAILCSVWIDSSGRGKILGGGSAELLPDRPVRNLTVRLTTTPPSSSASLSVKRMNVTFHFVLR